ncbi:MAG: sigma-54-dependent Fis family transcriptional regulator [Deltaproteobacteria bacterium]|nr:sigma-54-dependent Fis family transcriptional regulator [Deltaproteobacteria bacterium]
MRRMLEILLRRAGHSVDVANDGRVATERLRTGAEEYDLVITDLVMPDAGGMEVLAAAKAANQEIQVMMITAYATTEQAVEAMRCGAYDYVQKPFSNDEMRITVEKALEKRELLRENVDLRARIAGQFRLHDLLGKSEAITRVFEVCRKVAQTRTNVLITGESGTGKELVARALHHTGPRSDSPFIVVNCGAIPETLLESELFGHEKGAFTGAIAARKGLFAEASGGTLFLDEITELTPAMQVKLLRAIQERLVRAIGAAGETPVDVRLVAATNRDIDAEVQRGAFRSDLYYRLNVIRVRVPPLRERTGDIPLLAEHFLRKYRREQKKKTAGISPAALGRLVSYHFPGNVRELENLIERAVTLASEGSEIGLELIAPLDESAQIPVEPVLGTGMSLDAMIEDLERRALVEALTRSGGVRKRAAELLGISFRSIRYRLRKHGLTGAEDDASEEGDVDAGSESQ